MSLQVYVKGARDLQAQYPKSGTFDRAVLAYCEELRQTGYELVSVTLTTSSQYLFVFRNDEMKPEKTAKAK
jgi:hypothetical protein